MQKTITHIENNFYDNNEYIEDKNGLFLDSCRCYLDSEPEEFKDFKKFLGYNIPETIKKFYEEKLPFVISWTYRSTDNLLISSGQCALSGMVKYYMGPQKGGLGPAPKGKRHKYLIWYDGDNTDFIEKIERDFFIFDVVDICAHCYTLFQITEENPEPQLFLFTYPDNIYPLTLDFNTYIEYAEKLKGTHLWQEFFIDRDACDTKSLENLDKARSFPFFTTMKKVFPEIDFSDMNITQNSPEPIPSFYSVIEEKNYTDKFKTIFNNLEERMKDYEYDREFQPGLPLIRKVESLLGRDLPDSLLAFYITLNGFTLNWEDPNTEDSYRYCRVKFPELHDVFCGLNYTDNPKDPDLFNGLLVFDSDTENRDFARECYPIAIEEFHTTAIHFVEGQEEPDLYLFIDSRPYKLTVSFSEYIERFMETRGLMYWQYQFIDKEAMPNLDLSNDFVADMKALFPEVDLTPYRQE